MPNPWDNVAAFDAAIVTDPALMPGVEDVTFIREGEPEKPISAQVFRGDNVGTDMGVSMALVMTVARTAVGGCIHKGSDRFRLAKVLGGEIVECTVAAVLSQDAGGFTLQLE